MSFLELLQAVPAAFIGMCLILGLMVGSFLNVVIHRLPKMLELGWQQQCAELRGEEPATTPRYNLIVPRSACPHCNHAISAWENIPVVSYLLLRGKCKGCGAAISPRYPTIEAISGLLCGFAAWHFGFGWAAAGALLLVWALLALTAIDFDTQLLPDDITLPLLWAGLLFNLSDTFTNLHSAVLVRYSVILCYGPCTGCSNLPPARKAWVMEILNCLQHWAPGWVGRCCRSLFCCLRWSVR